MCRTIQQSINVAGPCERLDWKHHQTIVVITSNTQLAASSSGLCYQQQTFLSLAYIAGDIGETPALISSSHHSACESVRPCTQLCLSANNMIILSLCPASQVNPSQHCSKACQLPRCFQESRPRPRLFSSSTPTHSSRSRRCSQINPRPHTATYSSSFRQL